MEITAAHHHLTGCAACRAYRAEVTELHRSTRVMAAEPVPDLTAAILAAAPPPAARPADDHATVWRLGLLFVAIAQIIAAVAHLGGDHLARDQAAWEAALAAGFAWAAWRPTRTAGLLPLTVVLTVLLLVNSGLSFSGAGSHHLMAPLGLVMLVLATRTVDHRQGRFTPA